MGYAFNARQLAAIQRLLSGEHNIITNFVAGERADQKGFNYKYDEIQGCLAYIKQYSGTSLGTTVQNLRDVGDVAAPNPAADQFLVFDGDYWVPRTIEIPAPEDIKTNLSELNDVDIEQPQDRHILTYDSASQKWQNKAVNIQTPRIEDLSDVIVTNSHAGQMLEFDGANWINVDIPVVINRFDLLQDVNVVDPQQNQILKYNKNDEQWVSAPLEFDLMSGVGLNNLEDGDILRYDLNTETWHNKPLNESLAGLNDDVAISGAQNGEALIFENGYWKNQQLPAVINFLSGLNDVSINSPLDGQIIQFNSGSNKWENTNYIDELGKLKDINLTQLDSNQSIKFNGVEWVNYQITDKLDDLSDVEISLPSDKDALRFDSSTISWKNAPLTFSSLSDVGFSNISNYQIPLYNGGSWGNVEFKILNLKDVSSATPISGQTLIYNEQENKFESKALYINNLSDAHVSTPIDGQYLTFDQSQNKWINKTPPEIVNFLYGLDDVILSSPSNNQFLLYDGNNSVWKNQTVNIENLNNVSFNNLSTNDLFSYKQGEWSNTKIDTTYLSDFSLNQPAQDQIIYYDFSEQKWKNRNNTLEKLYDVSVNTVGSKEAIIYDSALNKWVNKSLRLDTHLTDLNVVAPENGQSLVFNGFKWGNLKLNNSLAGLEDMLITDPPVDGESVVFDAASNKWVNAKLSYGIEDLTNVEITSLIDGESLSYNQTTGKWVNSSPAVSKLNDVNIDNLLDGQFLSYNAGSNKWVNVTQQSIISNLSGLNDVNLNSVLNDQIIKYNSQSGKWVNADQTSVISALEQLTADVNISNPEDAQVLTYDGVADKWINSVISTQSISDFNISLPTTGQTLVYDQISDQWVNGVPSISIEELDDVVLTSPSANQSLIYDGAKWVNGVAAAPSTTQTTYQMNLSSTATRIDDVNNLLDRIYAVENIGEFEIYIGFDSSVNANTGYILYPGDILKVTLSSAGAIYGLATFGLGRVSVIRGR